MIKSKYYVYQLIDPRNNQVIYIGKGKENRMYNHEQVIKNGGYLSNEKLNNKIKSILDENQNIKYEQVYFTDDNDDAYRKETELIREYGLENLCNLTEVAWPPTMMEETKRKISEAKKGRKLSKEQIEKWKKSMEGYKHSEKTKKKISEVKKSKRIGEKNPFYNKHHSEETKRKMSKAHIGTYHSEETRRKMSETRKGRKRNISKKHKERLIIQCKENTKKRKGKTWEELYGIEVTEKMRILLKERNAKRKLNQLKES